MGLMRKALFLGTGGLGPNWSSKKERTMKAAQKSARIQRQILKEMQREAVPRYSVICPKCKATLASPAGGNIKCPTCGGRINVTPRARTQTMTSAFQRPEADLGANSVGPPTDLEGVFDVILADAGNKKIAVIKIVREATGLGLKETKALVDHAPGTIRESLYRDEAEALMADLEHVGATVELRRARPPVNKDAPAIEPTASPPALGVGTAGELERLADLHARGALNDVEFAAAKSKVLDT